MGNKGSRLEPIPLKELSFHKAPKTWQIDEFITGLDSSKPVTGSIKVQIKGQELYVEGSFCTIINLKCDRCLQNFNQELSYEDHELILIESKESRNRGNKQFCNMNTAPKDLLERIDPKESFNPREWTFEQLSLKLPLVNDCGVNCPGLPKPSSSRKFPNENNNLNHSERVDPRWEALKAFNQHEKLG